MQVRLDAQVPGTLLFRDPKGYVSFITLGVSQVTSTRKELVLLL
jgi:hypothetical protein